MVRITYIILVFVFFSCNTSEGNKEEEDNNIVKSYYDNGKLKSYYTVNDSNQRHGVAKSFNEDGVLTKSFEFVDGEQVKAVSHYENGNPLLEIYYKDGVKEGPFRRYYETGQLESEIEYKDNFPGIGLKEYTNTGELRTDYPKLEIKALDQIDITGKYTIEVYFDQSPSRGIYYLGDLSEGKFLSSGLEELKKIRDQGRYVLKPAPGEVINKKLSFIGEFETQQGNKYIAQKYFNLKIGKDN
ncbi:MAG: toxin-antitoxin system YwqK family antitoxin [Bacteroidota bacterium]